MVKKVLLVSLAAIMCFAFAACGSAAPEEPSIDVTGTTYEADDFNVLVPDGWSVVDTLTTDKKVYISEDINRDNEAVPQGKVYAYIEYDDIYKVDLLQDDGLPQGEDVWKDGKYGTKEELKIGDYTFTGGLTTYYVGEKFNDHHYWTHSADKVYKIRTYDEVPSDENQAAIQAILYSFEAK